MASSEVSEVFTSSFEDERTLNSLTADTINDDLYGSDELIVSSEDHVQSEEIVGASIADTLNDGRQFLQHFQKTRCSDSVCCLWILVKPQK